jgi:UTP--glucose-1-phosphate uridylyltransferase
MRTIIDLEAAASKVHALTCEFNDMPPGAQEALRGAADVINGIASLLRREKVFAYRYEGRRYDCGSKEGFLEANVELALQHPALGPGFRDWIKSLPL